MLCDEGAEVTHVDAPGVEPAPISAVLNRGKACVQLDLKSKPGLARLAHTPRLFSTRILG